MQCKKCGSKNLIIEKRGSANANVCADCGAWISWAKKTPEEITVTTVQLEAPVVVVSGPTDPCPYCDKDYVIPLSYDGGITGWDIIDAVYCPICGRKR